MTSIPDAQRRTAAEDGEGRLGVLRAVEQRVLWLSTAIVDHANRVRPNPSGLKVGGHQASSASMVSIMTALWFGQLQRGRPGIGQAARVAGAARDQLPARRAGRVLPDRRCDPFGGLQSYPSRSKDPDPADYSTGSVGIGATAPIWGALARRYVNAQFGGAGTGRQYSLVGDAELDEGAVWEAVIDPMVTELGEVVWIVDLNRQSLDRVVPIIGTPRLQGMFAAAGWQVLTVKYGRLLERAVRPARRRRAARPDRRDDQRRSTSGCCAAPPAELRDRLPGDGPDAGPIRQLTRRRPRRGGCTRPSATWAVTTSRRSADAFAAIDDTRPTVIFAYTVKGYGLAMEGHPQNHSALLSRGTARRAGAPGRRRSRAALAEVPGRLSRGRAVRGDRRAAASRAAGPAAQPGPCPPTSAVPRPEWPPPRPRSAGRCST